MYTSDGGTSWETCTDEDVTGGSKLWSSVFLTETGKAWAVGSSGRIVYSNDWGHTWESQESGVTDLLSEVYFLNDSVGWIVGGFSGNVILYTKNGGVTDSGTGGISLAESRNYRLEQNYPNPFTTTTQITYKLNSSRHVCLTIYDISGRKIQTLVNELRQLGEHSVVWDASHFSSGLYFYELKVDYGTKEDDVGIVPHKKRNRLIGLMRRLFLYQTTCYYVLTGLHNCISGLLPKLFGLGDCYVFHNAVIADHLVRIFRVSRDEFRLFCIDGNSVRLTDADLVEKTVGKVCGDHLAFTQAQESTFFGHNANFF